MCHFKVLSALMALLCLYSCSDIKLAEQLDGSWQTSYEAYDDGLVEKITQTMTFHYDENSWEDDGTFTETLSGVIDDIDLEFVDGTFDCKYRSRITGRWSVDQGDLSLVYNISTFEVEIDKNDVKINVNGYLSNADKRELKDELVRELQKNIQGELRNQYIESNSDGGSFLNLKVSGNKMSFDSSDLGRMEFKKISR